MLAILLCAVVFAGCGGEDEEAAPPPPVPEATAPQEEPVVAGGATTTGAGQAETLEDIPFTLNTEQPVPPDFQAAYRRQARIAVQFYKIGEDPFYPQGLEVDEMVRTSMERLRGEYPTIEFFSYDIDSPGTAQSSEELQPGEYGTLAAQLNVGITPFVAMMAPSGEEGYVITNLFQGYTPQEVLSQALFDLSAIEVQDNTSDVDASLQRLELTETGGGIEYVTISNDSGRSLNLQGFSVKVLDPESGQVDADSPGVTINEPIEVGPGASVSVGRVPDVVDADGQRVAGTFEGGEALDLAPGDQVALLDAGGAIADTSTV